MTQYTDRDALVVFTHGSSNMGGWQANNSWVTSDDLLPASLPGCSMWGRFLSTLDRNSKSSGGPFDWETMSSTQNAQLTGIAPPYAIARRYWQRYFSPEAQASAVSAPKAVYFLNYFVSGGRCTQDTGVLAAGASFHPGSENVVDTPAFEVAAEGYWTAGLQALEADSSIDRIFFDGLYWCGDESAARVSGSLTTDKTKYSVAGGVSDLVAATEFYCGMPQGSLPFVGVKPPLQYVVNNNVSATEDIAVRDITAVRDQYDRFLAITPNPAGVIDGNDFSLKSAEANPSHYTAESMLAMGQSLYGTRQGLAASAVLKERAVRTAVVPVNADE